jgi:alpha-amylase
MQYGSRQSLPISRVRLLRAKHFTGAYAVHLNVNVLAHDYGIRYWTKDFDTLNPHFGTADDLHALSDALHKRGMYLMLDVVVNHMAPLDPTKLNYTEFSPPFADASSFHKRCFVAESTDPSNQTAVEQCWLGDAELPLPDVNTENSTVSRKLLDWVQNMVQDNKVDGLRIDTVKHIRKDFWSDFSKAAGVFTLGEVLINDTDYAAQYTGR